MTHHLQKQPQFFQFIPQQICSRLLFEEVDQSATLYTMDKEESISEERNDSASLYILLKGSLELNLIEHGNVQHDLQGGQIINIPTEISHSLFAHSPCAYIKIQGGNMMSYINKLPHNEVISLADSIEYVQDQVTSKTVVSRADLGITLFAVDGGQQIRRHVTAGDALAQIIDGAAEIEIGDELHVVEAGQSIVMPAGIPHALYGKQAFKMLLVVVKPPKA